jgi:AcrR family transcriptional regulator
MSRPRSATATRAAILDAARVRFGESGYDRTTLRAIAADVGVDPAMVIRYFRSKEQLFAAAATPDVHLPDLVGVAPEDFTAALLPNFFLVFEDEGTFLPLLRAAATDPTAAELMVATFANQVGPAFEGVAPDHPHERAALLGSQILGLAFSRYVLRTPPLAAMSRDQLQSWLDPVVRHYLTGPAPS